jgi:hypothetical protein
MANAAPRPPMYVDATSGHGAAVVFNVDMALNFKHNINFKAFNLKP